MKKYTLSMLAITIACFTHAQSWNLTGNTGTDPSIHFLGTTDNKPLRFRVANGHAGEINYSTGQTSLGYGAGQGRYGDNSRGNYNTAIGYASMYYNAGGNANTAMGVNSLVYNSTGSDNVALGSSSMYLNTTGSYNVGIGSGSFLYAGTGYFNTAVGYWSAHWYDLGWNNTLLGAYTNGSFDGQYNIIAIGQGVTCPDNSTARIGNTATWSIGGFAGWSNFSDGRYKKDIKENVKGLDFIMKLRPVTYRLDIGNLSKQLKENNGEEWNDQMKTAIAEKEKMVMTGFVAQEVEQAAKETDFDFSGVDKPRRSDGYYALRYADFVVPLVKAMQEQQEMIRQLQAKVDKLEKQADVAILLQSSDADKLTVYPNPANNYMTINVQTQHAGKGTLQIYESGGKLIKQMNVDFRTGVNTLHLSLPELPAGVYNLKLNWGKGLQKQVSFVKD